MRIPLLMLLISACSPGRQITRPSPELQAVIDGQNQFAVELVGRLAPGSNLAVAPLSVSSALGMVWMGAEGTTGDELADVLGITVDKDVYGEQYGSLVRDLSGDQGRPYTLSVANGVWASPRAALVSDYARAMDEAFEAPVEKTNFETSAALDAINAFVSRQTRGRIDPMLSELSPDTLVALVNALYFEADWADPFEETRTAFFYEEGGPVEVQMLSRVGSVAHATVDGMQIIELPYAGGDLSMFTITNLPEDLSAAALQAALEQVESERVEVVVPEFEVSSSLELPAVLQAMGVSAAFRPGADLTGMTPVENVFIDEVLHKAVIEVDAQGTEAAGATVATVAVTSVQPGPPPTPILVVDQPFHYVIRDRHTGVVVFMGRVVDSDALSRAN